MEDMLAGQKAVKSFQEANADYMACVEARIEAAKKDSKAAKTDADREAAREAETAAVTAYNTAVTTEEALAGDFNTQIRAYNAAQK